MAYISVIERCKKIEGKNPNKISNWEDELGSINSQVSRKIIKFEIEKGQIGIELG